MTGHGLGLCVRFSFAETVARGGGGRSRGPDPLASNKTTYEICANFKIFGWIMGGRGSGGKSTTTRSGPLALKTWRRP